MGDKANEIIEKKTVKTILAFQLVKTKLNLLRIKENKIGADFQIDVKLLSIRWDVANIQNIITFTATAKN